MPVSTVLFRSLAAAPLVVLLTVAGCSGAPDAGRDTGATSPATRSGATVAPADVSVDGAASCIAAVTYRDTLYVQVAAPPVTAGEALAGAEVPPCNDTGGSDTTATSIDAYAIDRVEPRYAVMSTSAGGQFVYVAERYVAGRDGGLDLPAEVSAVLGVE
jgi:hypothetical protein